MNENHKFTPGESLQGSPRGGFRRPPRVSAHQCPPPFMTNPKQEGIASGVAPTVDHKPRQV